MVRRGSIGDSSGNDFSGAGGGSSTTAGSGSTGDDSDNDFGSGGTDDDGSTGDVGGSDDDFGGSDDDFGGDSDSDFGGGDDDSDYDPNPSDREVGGDDDNTLDDITGGRNFGDEQSQSTGDSDSRNQGGAGGGGDTDDTVSTGDGDEVARPDSDADRGVSRTEGPQGISLTGPVGSVRETLEANTDMEFRDRQAERQPQERTDLQGGDIRLLNAAQRQSQQPAQGGDVRLANAAEGTTQEQPGRFDIYASGLGALGSGVAEIPSINLRQGVQNARAVVSEGAELTEQVRDESMSPVVAAMRTGRTLGEELRDAEADQEAVRDLTSGGLLTPSEESRVRRASRQFSDDLSAVAENEQTARLFTAPGGVVAERVSPTADIETNIDTPVGDIQIDTVEDGETSSQRFRESAVEGVGQAGNVFAIGGAAETGVEVAENLPDEAEAGDLDTAAATGGAVVRETGEQAVETARQNPSQALGNLAGSAVVSVAGGVGAGKAARFGRDRARTAGGTEVDLEDVTQESVVRNVETNDAEGDRFPGAADEDLYEADPAESVRRQASDKTPDVVSERFEEAGVEEGVVLKKALDVEPEGPRSITVRNRQINRDTRGFTSAPAEADGDFEYETPGSFAGPELSPNFLRVQGRSRVSLRPGLPSFGGQPTGVLVKTDVDSPDADTLQDFNAEMLERSGETTARTKPADVGTPEETEAIIPPGSEFRDIGGSRVRAGLRRAGIGSDFFTEVGGRRVPLRPVAPDGNGDRTDLDTDDVSTQAFTSRSLSDIRRAGSQPVDRPLPPTPVGASNTSTRGDDLDSDPSTLETGRDMDAASLDSDRTTTASRRGTMSDGERSSVLSDSGASSAAPPSGGSTSPPTDVSEPVSGVSEASSAPSDPGSTAPPSEGAPSPAPSERPPSSPPAERPPSAPPSRGPPSQPPSRGPPTAPPTRVTPVPTPGTPQLTESEIDSDGDDERRRRFDRDLADFEKDFSYDVATPEDVLSGEASPLEDS